MRPVSRYRGDRGGAGGGPARRTPGHVVLLPWTPPEEAGMRSPISILTRTTAADAGFVRRMNWAEDLVTLVLTAWLIGGLFLDGWAHNTRPQLETFFTPWHAVFYSGFA